MTECLRARTLPILFPILLLSWGCGPASEAPKTSELADDEGWIVGPGAAAELVRREDAALLDARSKDAWRREHVAGALHFDWESFTPESEADRGRLLEEPAVLQERLRALGISEGRPVVVVGAADGGWGEAGRGVWMLRTLGHDRVAWVDGGHRALVETDLSASTATPTPDAGDFDVERRSRWTISRQRLRDIHDEDGVALLDTRSEREYGGETPYGESRGGHVPGARHLYFRNLIGDKGRLRPADDLRSTVESAGVDSGDRIVTYCTGGVRSAWVLSVLIELGYEDVRNYAGSTWEWSSGDSDRYPLETD